MYLQRDTAILFVTVNCLINGVGSIEVVRGDTATIVCDIAGTFVSPSWDDGTSTTVYIAESQTMFNPSTTDSRWSRSSDTKNLIITSIEDSDVGTYRCSILTPITDSYTATLTVTNQTAGLDGTCSNTAPIIECSTENAECSATNKCECKTGYEPNAAATECIPSTTSTTNTQPDTNTTHPTTSMPNGTSTSTIGDSSDSDGLPDWEKGVIAGGSFLAIVIIGIIAIIAKKLNLCCFKKKDVEENQTENIEQSTKNNEQSANNIQQSGESPGNTRV